eukprot:gene6012-10014_t
MLDFYFSTHVGPIIVVLEDVCQAHYCLLAQDVEMSQYTFTLDLRKVSNQDGVTSYTSKNSQDYPEYETEEIVSTGPLQETDELEEVSVSEAKTESMSAVLSAARKVGGIIKTFIIKGLKAFKIKAGVLKGFIISQGKALPKKFVKYLKDYVKKLKNMPGKAKKLIKNIKKDGIFKVVKAHRAKNLNKVKALGSYTKITASGGKIVKFSAKRLIKEFTKQFMVAYGRKVAMGLGKKLAMEYAKFTYNTVVNHETTEQKKKFNKLEAIKKYFVAAQFCWKQTWGAGIGWIPSSCPRSHPIKGRVFVNHLCYRNCRHGYEKVRGGCATKCPKYFWTHRSYCQQNKTWYYAWASGGKCSRREGFHMHRWKRGICVRPNRKISRRFYRDPQVNRVKYKICPRGQNKQGGLCYNNCPRGYTKGGPYCWQTCPRDLPNTCGAMCTKTPSACAKKIAGLVFNGVSAAVNAAVGNYASAALDIASTVQELASIPKCPVDPRGKPPKIPKHYRKCYSKTLVGGVRVTLCCVDGNCSLKSMKFPNHHKLTNKTLFHVQRTHSRWYTEDVFNTEYVLFAEVPNMLEAEGDGVKLSDGKESKNARDTQDSIKDVVDTEIVEKSTIHYQLVSIVTFTENAEEQENVLDMGTKEEDGTEKEYAKDIPDSKENVQDIQDANKCFVHFLFKQQKIQ